MASKVPSMRVKSATGKLNKFDMSSSLITTSNFGVMKPVKAITCVQGDKINISVSEFTRLMPMPVPTYGSIKSKTRAFFVPFRTIFKPWLSFISNNKKVTSNAIYNPVSVPTISISQLLTALIDSKFTTYSLDSSVAYDFLRNDGTKNVYYTFTPLGKRIADWFSSIGVNICDSNTSISISFLPFMAYAKFYLDWVVPSRFVNLYSPIIRLFEFETTEAINAYIGNTSNLREILIAFYAYYEDDYFTSAWQNSSGTEVEMASDTVIPGQIASPSGYFTDSPATNFIPNDYGTVRGNESQSPLTQTYQQSGDPLFINNGAIAPQNLGTQTVENDTDSYEIKGVPPLNYFTIRSIGALQDMINRGKLAGTKVQEYLRLTYGFEPSVDAMNLSTYLGCKENEIMIGDVMSTSGTDLNSLGQYAGRGIGGGDASFSYECQEHGIFFVTNELVVKPSYVDGLDFIFDQKDRFDFFDPVYDNIGCEALPLKRLSTSAAQGPSSNQYIFGFTPRYSAYKFAFDRLSGDFRLNSKNAGLDSWYLTRTFNKNNASLWRFINDEFCKASSDLSLNNLDRIFNDTTNNVDHFYSIFRINCSMLRPMLPFSEALETYHHNELGKEMNTSINGGLAR